MMVFKTRIVLSLLALAAITSCTAKTKATVVYGRSSATSQMSADQSEFYTQLQADLIVEGLSDSQAAALIQNLKTAELRSLTLSALAADKMSESKILAITARVAALLPSFAAADAQTVVAALTRTVTHSSIKQLGTNVSSAVTAALVSAAETVPGTSESPELLQRMLKGANAAITALQLEASQTRSAFGSFAGNLVVESVNVQTTASGVSALMTSLTSTFISEVLTAGLPSEMFTGAMNALNAALASAKLKTAAVSADDFASTLGAGIVAATVGSADKLPSTLVSAFVNQISVGMLKVAAPKFSVAAGAYAAAQSVTLATTTPGAAIYYTLDDTAPTTVSTLYSGAISVPSNTTIRALAVLATWVDSSIARAAYTILSYGAAAIEVRAGVAFSVQPLPIPSVAFDSVNVEPALPTGLSIDHWGVISGTTSTSVPEETYTILLMRGSDTGSIPIRLKSVVGISLATAGIPLRETKLKLTWSEPSYTPDAFVAELLNGEGAIVSSQRVASGLLEATFETLTPGSQFFGRVTALRSSTSAVADATDRSTSLWTPYGAINADSVSTPPQEPWKPSGLEGAVFSENFSIVWSFFYNPGFTPAWKGVPSKDQKGDFYFNTAMNKAYKDTNGILWGDTGSRDDVTQLWTNGVDKFMVATTRGRLHLWDHLPNAPNLIAATREIGRGSTNRSTFSGAASACYDSSTDKLYVVNSGRNRVLVFSGWPTTTSPDADFVLGQPDFETFTAATTSTGMSSPYSVSCEGGIVAVADYSNNRILVWTKAISANNQAADFIYGQSNATSGGANGAGGVGVGGSNSFRNVLLVPRSSGGYALLSVASLQNRVVEWDLIPATPGSQTFPGAFNRVYGQPDSTTITANTGGQSMSSMAAPVHLSHERDKDGMIKKDIFWVTDGAYWATHNARVLKFQRGTATATDLWGDATGSTTLSGWTYPVDHVGFWWANYVNYSRIGCLGSQGIFNLGSYIWKQAPANGLTASDFVDGDRCHSATAGGKTWVAKGAAIWGVGAASGMDVPSPMTETPILLGRKNADGSDNTGMANTYQFKIDGVNDLTSIGSSILVRDTQRIVIWNTSNLSLSTSDLDKGVSAVIGQPTKTTNAANQGGLSAKTLSGPTSMVVSSGKIIVADRGNNRVLIWNSLPTTDNQAADVVLGQANGTTDATGTGLDGMNSPMSAAVINGKLVVADRGNLRVLVWSSIPTVSGTAATKSMDLRDLTFELPSWYNPNALAPVWIGTYGGKVYVEQYGRILVIPDIF